MSYPNIIENYTTGINNLESKKVNLSDLVNLIYPIGSIYMSVNNVSPETFLGGTWEQIKDTFLLCAGAKYSAGSTGGEEFHLLTVAETPSHSHTRGNMNITGSYICDNEQVQYATGAFYGSSASGSGCSNDTVCSKMNFDASRSWTGSTSEIGGNQVHNNMPPYLTVYCWKRVS